MTEKISITRALRELKLLDDRINKTIQETPFLDVFQGRRKDFAMMSKKTVSEFDEMVKSKYQSIKDLIDRRKKIKQAIMVSNAKTDVKIAGETYLVIEAIEKKQSIKYEKQLLQSLKQDREHVKKEVDKNTSTLNQQIETMINNSLGSDKKVDKDTYSQIANPVLEANEVKILDPIKIDREIEKLEKQIDDFEAEVDFVLSESNSKTEIEI